MTVKGVPGVKGGFATYHCHGKNKGKRFGKIYRGRGAKKKAYKQHVAVVLSKIKRAKEGKGEMPKASKQKPKAKKGRKTGRAKR